MKDILDSLQTLQDTPLPNLFVIMGFVFLFLAFVGKFGAFVELPKDRQRWAGIIGFFLLVIGIILFTIPKPQPNSTPTAVVGATTDTLLATQTPGTYEPEVVPDTPVPEPTDTLTLTAPPRSEQPFTPTSPSVPPEQPTPEQSPLPPLPTNSPSSRSLQRMAFSIKKSENWDVYIMNEDGTESEPLLETSADEMLLDWSEKTGQFLLREKHKTQMGSGWELFILESTDTTSQ